jgi:tRNA(Arg) A34 adenosine deaminase TadA
MLFPSGDVTSHAELNAIRDLAVSDLSGYTMLTTMPPCWMCGGAARHFKLSRLLVVRQPYDSGSAAWLDGDEHAPVVVEPVESPEAVDLFERWRADHPELWPNPRLDAW